MITQINKLKQIKKMTNSKQLSTIQEKENKINPIQEEK